MIEGRHGGHYIAARKSTRELALGSLLMLKVPRRIFGDAVSRYYGPFTVRAEP